MYWRRPVFFMYARISSVDDGILLYFVRAALPAAVARLGRCHRVGGVVPAGEPAVYPHSTLQQTAAPAAAELAATTGAAERTP